MILPQMDQGPLFNQINFLDQSGGSLAITKPNGLPAGGPTGTNTLAMATVLPALLCPSNPQPKIVTGQSGQFDSWGDGLIGGRTDYVGNCGWSFPGHRNCGNNNFYNNNPTNPDWSDWNTIDGLLFNQNGVIGLWGCIDERHRGWWATSCRGTLSP